MPAIYYRRVTHYDSVHEAGALDLSATQCERALLRRKSKRLRFEFLERLFRERRRDEMPGRGNRVLILNWRDPWHPKSGGAEHFTLRVAETLAVRGWHVEWFSGAYPGAPREETRHGIRFIRAGSQTSVHLFAFLHYARSCNFDVIVDEINTIPFFAHLYSRVPVVVLMFQLAREVWLSEAPWPLSHIGFAGEPLYLAGYRRRTVITISESSAMTFRELGHIGTIHVVPIAVDEKPEEALPDKSPNGDIIVVSRVTPSKRIGDAVRGAALLADGGWQGTLHIIGGGEARYVKELKALASRLGILRQVCFHGRVSNQIRSELMRSASLLWMSSLREGWGLVVTEAARHATPAVVYNVPGLRDAVVDGVTGYVVPEHPECLADATRRLWRGNYSAFANAALDQSLRFSWEKTTSAVERVLLASIAAGRLGKYR